MKKLWKSELTLRLAGLAAIVSLSAPALARNAEGTWSHFGYTRELIGGLAGYRQGSLSYGDNRTSLQLSSNNFGGVQKSSGVLFTFEPSRRPTLQRITKLSVDYKAEGIAECGGKIEIAFDSIDPTSGSDYTFFGYIGTVEGVSSVTCNFGWNNTGNLVDDTGVRRWDTRRCPAIASFTAYSDFVSCVNSTLGSTARIKSISLVVDSSGNFSRQSITINNFAINDEVIDIEEAFRYCSPGTIPNTPSCWYVGH